MDKIIPSDVNIAPLRPLNDFILGDAKFQVPNFKDLEKWGHRVVNNLLYYQTNYFLLALIIFLIVGCMHPEKMLLGFVAMSVLTGVFAYFSTEGKAVHNFKRKYPIANLVLIVFGASFVTYTLGSLLVFLVGILSPFCAIFVHASLRLRSLKNKITNIGSIGLKNTPMGMFLASLGMEQEFLA